MGYREMFEVRASGLTDRTQVDVLEALAFFKNEKTGKCFPSTEALARVSRVNPNLVRKTIRDLVNAGLVSYVQEPGKPRYFTLNLGKLPKGVDESEPLKDREGVPLEESKGVEETTPLEDRKGDPLRKVKGTPLVSSSTPLEVPKAEQGREQGREQGKFSGVSDDAPPTLFEDETPLPDDVPPWLFDDLPVTDPAPASKPATKKPKRSRAASDAWPVEGDGIDADTRAAYLAVRKAKRVGPFTAKAYEQIKAQGEKFGRSMAETIGVCIGRGWVYPYDSALQQSNSTNGKNNGIQDDRRGFVLTPQSEYDYEAGLRMFEERRAARRARDA